MAPDGAVGAERQLEALLRQNLLAFADKAFATLTAGGLFRPNWHLELICDHLECVRRGEIRRLIINMPPRSLKSHLVSVAFPGFLLGHDPRAHIIVASYGADLAAKLGADTRTLLQTAWYRDLFPETRLAAKNPAAEDFSTTARGNRLAVSAGGPITGRGAGLIIIDDPLKATAGQSDVERDNVNSWFDQNVLQRLDDKVTGAVILIMQRLHEDDLTGHLLAKGGWVHLKLAAIAEEDEAHHLPGGKIIRRGMGEALHPAREPLEVLDQIRREIGSYNFAGQYQQEPAPREGGHVRADWFPRQSSDGVRFDMLVQSWDTAHKTGEHNDWSVCTTWGRTSDDRYFLLDVHRAKLAFPDLAARCRALYEHHRPGVVLVEDGANGTSLIQALRHEGQVPVSAVRPEGDKETRLVLLTGLIESQRVILPVEAPWIDEFLLEITRFPRARHDDQVDSFTQGLTWIWRRTKHAFW
jgi:predicted phage terminase large subunit-like protein